MTAAAAGVDLVAGVSVTGADGRTSVAFLNVLGDPLAVADGRFRPVATGGWIAARHTSRDGLGKPTFVAGGGVRLQLKPDWFLSEQLVAVSHRSAALSSRFQFASSLGWQRGHWLLMVRHISNGHLIGRGRNKGETMLLGGVTW